jgi:hypothetical protein
VTLIYGVWEPGLPVTSEERTLADVVVINGPAGVGKTTISSLLAKSRPGTINISGDALRWFAPSDVRDHLGPGSTYRVGASLTATYLAMGAPRVLFDYVFDAPDKISRFCRSLPDMTRVYFFTVWAPLEVVVRREATRPGRERLGERTVETYRALERNLHALGDIIENAETAESAVAEILDKIAGSKGISASRLATAPRSALKFNG